MLDTVCTRVVGRGEISLRDERLDLHLCSEPKDGSGPPYLGGSVASPPIRPEPRPLGTRLAGAAALDLISPPLALRPLIETGGAADTPCADLFARSTVKPPAP